VFSPLSDSFALFESAEVQVRLKGELGRWESGISLGRSERSHVCDQIPNLLRGEL